MNTWNNNIVFKFSKLNDLLFDLNKFLYLHYKSHDVIFEYLNFVVSPGVIFGKSSSRLLLFKMLRIVNTDFSPVFFFDFSNTFYYSLFSNSYCVKDESVAVSNFNKDWVIKPKLNFI